MILTLKNKKQPAKINAMKVNITIVVSDFLPNPIAELMIKVIRKVKNNDPPLSIPVTCASPIGNANSHPRS